QKDFSMALIQAKSLDRRLKEDGNRVYQMAQLSLSNEDYESAIDGFSYIVSKGTSSPWYWKSRIDLLNTRFAKIIAQPGTPPAALSALEKEFAAEIAGQQMNSENSGLYKNYAHLLAFYLDKTTEAIDLLNRVLNNSSIDAKHKAECKLEMADIQLFSGDVWESTLLYQQVYQDFKNDVMGETAKFKNAKLSYYIGEFKWAQTQLDILKAATSRLIANDAMELALLISENFDPDSGHVALTYYSHADLLDYRNHEDAALQTLDSIFKAFSYHEIFDEVLLKQANIKLKQGKVADADTLLGTLISRYPEGVRADEALYLRAKINEDKKDKAMNYYSQLMNRYPGSVFVVDARKRYRTLRGDNVQ
ncbi:MAG: tetratricopeptide repeat protein, partial [Syntrophothermus sp.]